MKSHNTKNWHAQKGGALIILALILMIAGATALFAVLDGNSVKIERDKNIALMLSKAKTALLGLTIKAIGSGKRPGDLIIPDSFGITEVPTNYDGSSDSGCLNASASNGLPLINSDVNMRCLGRLPWKDLGIAINAPTENDASGIMPWYAVSANLVDTNCLKVLNSNTLNLVYSLGTLDCSGATLPYPWLTVRDSNGNIVSNRVAAIIFAPGVARGTQSRPSPPGLGVANQYLDTLVVPAGCAVPCIPGAYSNADMDNDFIVASEGMPLASASNFNDQLVYITIEELIATVEKRVAGEVRSQLTAYKAVNSNFPDAASLGYQGQSCVQGLNSGFLPLPICSCTGSKCDCTFPATIKFTSDRNYTSNNGSCTYSTKICTCTGAGSCLKTSSPSRSFVCSSTGTCVSNVTGTFNYTPSLPIDNSSMSIVNGACTLAGSTATCTGAGNVAVNGAINQCTLPKLNANNFPSWFLENGWKHFIFYAKGSLAVGTNSASSLVVTSGSMLAAQSRPSNLVANYLDSPENSNGDMVFDAVGTPRNSTYNDQMFIVAP